MPASRKGSVPPAVSSSQGYVEINTPHTRRVQGSRYTIGYLYRYSYTSPIGYPVVTHRYPVVERMGECTSFPTVLLELSPSLVPFGTLVGNPAESCGVATREPKACLKNSPLVKSVGLTPWSSRQESTELDPSNHSHERALYND